MDKEQMITELKKWQKSISKIDNLFESFNEAVGVSPDGPMFDALYTTIDKYTDALERSLVGNNNPGWLSWYAWENGMGAKEFEANPGTWSEDKKIKNLSDLADLLIAKRDDNHLISVVIRGGTLEEVYTSANINNSYLDIIDFDNEDNSLEENYERTKENLWRLY